MGICQALKGLFCRTLRTGLRLIARHVEALIGRSGLVVGDVFGDWDAGPFDPAPSREMILIAEISG